jgi:hypothetical protein
LSNLFLITYCIGSSNPMATFPENVLDVATSQDEMNQGVHVTYYARWLPAKCLLALQQVQGEAALISSAERHNPDLHSTDAWTIRRWRTVCEGTLPILERPSTRRLILDPTCSTTGGQTLQVSERTARRLRHAPPIDASVQADVDELHAEYMSLERHMAVIEEDSTSLLLGTPRRRSVRTPSQLVSPGA